jgi:hypothetical protein
MAYQIYKTNGTFLTSISDGTLNTTSTSVGLPGRNYAGYGNILDTNFVHIIENFASNTVPPNPITGQLWYNTNVGKMYVCPTDGETDANNWSEIAQAGGTGNTTFGNVSVNGTLTAGNIYANSGTIGANTGNFNYLNVSVLGAIGNANITTGNVTTLNTTLITSGSNVTPGNIFGTWSLTGGNSGVSLNIANGNVVISNATPGVGIKCDNLMYANGANIFGGGGPYSNSNVATYLPTYNGNVGGGTATFVGTTITTGAAGTAGTITGTWSLVGASRLQATYADLAERFEADTTYDPGTVVQLGGTKEITAVKLELSEDVFGVISNSAAYLMNAGAGDDQTHPPVAVSGRVHVKVMGQVAKGQRLVSAGNGIARAADQGEATAFNTIGRALADKTTHGVGTVEAIVIIR